MGKIKGWSKGTTINGNETWYNTNVVDMQLDIWKWRKGQLHYPETRVSIYHKSKEILRKDFLSRHEAKKFAIKYMKSNSRG